MFKTFVEKNPVLFFISALLLGIGLPLAVPNTSQILTGLMIVLLTIAFLKVDVQQVYAEFKNPLGLLTQIVLNFILLPIGLFFILHYLGFTEFALATLLLALMPAGLGGPVLTALAGGRVETSAVLSVITHMLIPITVPLSFWLLTGVDVEVDVVALAKQLSLLIIIPIILATILRTWFQNLITSTQPAYKIVSIFSLATVAYLVMAPYAETIRNDMATTLVYLVAAYGLYLVFCLTSFAFSKKRTPEDRSALVISRVYMNNALAIIIAFQFFSPEVALITILGEIPWFTSFGAYMWFQKKYIGL